MKVFNKKYLAVGFILLALLANVSYAYSEMICSMKMQKTCCCECEAMDNSDASISMDAFSSVSKTDCCKQELKEISNSADLQFNQQVSTGEAAIIAIIPAEVNLSSADFTISPIQNPYRHMYRDISILNSTFRI